MGYEDLAFASRRVEEIECWLAQNLANIDVSAWVALDDLPLAQASPALAAHMGRVDPSVGLSDEDLDRALQVLLDRCHQVDEEQARPTRCFECPVCEGLGKLLSDPCPLCK